MKGNFQARLGHEYTRILKYDDGKDYTLTAAAREGQHRSGAPSTAAKVLNKAAMQILLDLFRHKELLTQVLVWKEGILA